MPTDNITKFFFENYKMFSEHLIHKSSVIRELLVFKRPGESLGEVGAVLQTHL